MFRHSPFEPAPTPPLKRAFVWAAISFERYGLSSFLFYRVWERCMALLANTGNEHTLIQNYALLEIFRQITWIQFDAFTALLLLVGRRVTVPPQRLRDILVPLAATFFYLLYEALPWFPSVLTRNLSAPAWQPTGLAIGLGLNLVGFCIALWAALSLGRSFGILVEVKKVVTAGAYRWVRHPMYFSYLFLFSGWAVANCSLAFLILPPMHLAVLLYRARLEEERLAQFSAEYRAYQARTGFFFPKFFRS